MEYHSPECTLLYCTVLYSTLHCSSVQYSTVQYNVLQASYNEEVLYHMKECNIDQDNHNPLDILKTLVSCPDYTN